MPLVCHRDKETVGLENNSLAALVIVRSSHIISHITDFGLQNYLNSHK